MKTRWLFAGLAVSLALNLFLVGLGVGAVVFGKRHQAEPPPSAGEAGARRAPLWAAGRTLPEPHRRAFREVLIRATMQTRADLIESRRLKREAFDAMASDSYDAPAAAAKLERARALEFGARTKVEQDITAFAATLPRAEREALAEALRATMARPPAARQPRPWRGEDGPPPIPPPAE